MNSLVQLFTRSLFVLVIVFFVTSHGRPLSDVEIDDDVEAILRSVLVPAKTHQRTFARKRHAEIRLSSEISRRIAELKRIQALKQLMSGLDTSQVYTVRNRSASNNEMHNADGRENETPDANERNEVYPTTPSLQELAPHLLQQINGQQVNGGVKIKVINGQQPGLTTNSQQFMRSVENAHNAVALATTCKDMQNIIAMSNLRLRVRCRLDANSGSNRSNRRLTRRRSS